jgi:hypothetical protein
MCSFRKNEIIFVNKKIQNMARNGPTGGNIQGVHGQVRPDFREKTGKNTLQNRELSL